MHCFSRAWIKQLWRVAEWLVRKKGLVPRTRAAVVVNPAAAAPPEVVAVDKVAADAHQAVVAEAARVVEDKVAVDAHQVVVGEAAKVVVVRAAVVVDVPLVVAVDKVVAEAAVAQVVEGAAADFRAVADREVEEAVVDVLPAVAGAAGAAETVNSLSSSGASRVRGAPLFY